MQDGSKARKVKTSQWKIWFTPAFRATLILLALMFLGNQLIAQATSAEIVGSVHDQTGSVIPGAAVSLTNKGTAEVRKTTSAGDGAFTFNLVPPGTYTVSIEAPNFKRFEVPDLTLAVGDKPRLEASLSVGSAGETVSVEATSPLLQSENSTLQSSINKQAVQDLPLNGRNFIQLVQLIPGSNEGPPNGLTNGTKPDDKRSSAAFSANGQSDVLNNQMIDGMDNNEGLIGSIGVRPSVDAVGEIRVQTNVYSADTGRTGGAAVNIITKSGTNNFHGTVYEYFRNDIFNSYPFQFGAHNPKQELRQNQFGASIGGPIFKNKTFFFGDYEGFRLVNGANPTISTVPTLFEEQHPGNFTDQLGSNNVSILAPSSLDPAALNYLKLFPAPNLPNIGGICQPNGSCSVLQGQYVGVAINTQFSNVYDIRLDHQINDKNSIFGRYSYNNVKTWNPGTFPVVPVAGLSIQPIGSGYSPSNDHNVSLSYTHTFSQNLLGQLQAGYLRVDNETYPAYFGNGNKVGPAVNTAYGMPGVNINQVTGGLAHVGWSNGYTALGGGGATPLADLTNAFQGQATVTYTHGQHNFKFGSAVIRRHLTSIQSVPVLPQWTFLNLPTFEQGAFTSVSRALVLVNPHYRRWEPSVYAQDDWHITGNTTLNLGIRYDIFTPNTEISNAISNWDPVHQALVVAGTSGVSATGNVQTIYSNVAPRVGFSTTVRPGLVVRGGFGISYFPAFLTSNATLKNAPFLSAYGPYSTSNAAANGYAAFSHLINGAPPATPTSATNPVGQITATDPKYRPTVAYQYNLAIQKDFHGNVLTVAYVGVTTRHVVQSFPDENAPPPNTSANANTLRPTFSKYPGLTTIKLYASGGVGSYNAAQISFERRLSHGLSFNTNYTYARNIDNATGLSNQGQGGYAPVISQSHIYDYGNSDLDLRNRGVATLNYTLPFGRTAKGFKGEFVKGWQINTIGAWSAGQPFTPLNGSNISNVVPGGGGDRPNRIGNPTLPSGKRTLSAYFNTAAYVTQSAGTVGASGRNTVYGPHYRHVDMSLIKPFPIRESIHLDFRAEAFNITNTTNFSPPSAPIGNANFGKVIATSPLYSPRVFQFALKLVY
jgi:hypothetical protein